jgi:hypothetical protein
MHLALALPRGAGHWCHLVPRRTLSDRTNGSVTAVTKTKFFHPPLVTAQPGGLLRPLSSNSGASTQLVA